VKWTRQTLRELARRLAGRKYAVSHETVRRLLGELGYTLRVNRKRLGKHQDPQRDLQMRYLARQRRAFWLAGKPVIFVDTKKKELIGPFKNPGRTWRLAPREVLATDFPSDAEGKAIPYGVYDAARQRGFVGVGVSHETAAFAVNVIRAWWRAEGRAAYAGHTELLIQADAGGANHCRSDLWKWELQCLADETGLTISVTHYPTSASKWNWADHRLFSAISANWAGQPLDTYATVLNFIRGTTTDTGLTCTAYLDRRNYPTGRKLTPEQKAMINRFPHVRPRWNYTIRPNHSNHAK
jgi:hypothetical protein